MLRYASILALVVLSWAGAAVAQDVPAAPPQPFDAWLADVRAEALTRGIRPEVLDAAFADVKPVEQILDRDRTQAEFALEADEKTARGIEERFDVACAAMVARGAEIIIPADGVLNEFLVRRRRLSARGGVPVMDSLGALFQHAAFLVKLKATTGTTISRHQFYAKPSAAMVEHVRTFAGQRKLASDFSGDR